MEETGVLTDGESDGDEGPTEYDVAAQQAPKWSEVASLPIEGESMTTFEMTKKGEANTPDAGVEPQAAEEHTQSSAKLWMKLRDHRGQLIEVLILAPIMLVMIGLFLIPTVLYASSVQEIAVEPPSVVEGDCLQAATYSGEVCRETFVSMQTCFSGEASPLNIPSRIDQEAGERNARNLVDGLLLLGPSLQCREAILPFLCLSTFTLCDTSNNLHTILREDCLELRDNICAEEWSRAVAILGRGVLPDCEQLPNDTDRCIETNSSLLPNVVNITNSFNDQQIKPCSKGFFFDENVTNLCRPTCGQFRRKKIGVQVLEITATCMCFVASIVMFILALYVQRKNLLQFPSVLLVYMCVTTLLLSVVIIVGFFDNDALFCGARDLIRALFRENETAFCTISGFVFMYALQQICIWGGIHAGFLFWVLKYPFSYRTFKLTNRIRYAHVISVLLAVVLPLPGALIHLKGGFVVTGNPALVCAGRNTDYTYYTFILPLSVILVVTTCLLVLIFSIILKEFVIKKMFSKKRKSKVGTAQLKITVILIYYTVVGVMGLTTSTVSFTSYAATTDIAEYVACESRGMADCTYDSPLLSSTLALVVVVLISFLPVVAIVFSCSPRACRSGNKKWKALPKKTSILSGLGVPASQRVQDNEAD